MVWYFANSACQLFSENGGSTPVIGFHSTMERPDSVNRVAPPTTRVKKIIAAVASSHSRTARRSILDALAVSGIRVCSGKCRVRRAERVQAAPRHSPSANMSAACRNLQAFGCVRIHATQRLTHPMSIDELSRQLFPVYSDEIGILGVDRINRGHHICKACPNIAHGSNRVAFSLVPRIANRYFFFPSAPN